MEACIHAKSSLLVLRVPFPKVPSCSLLFRAWGVGLRGLGFRGLVVWGLGALCYTAVQVQGHLTHRQQQLPKLGSRTTVSRIQVLRPVQLQCQRLSGEMAHLEVHGQLQVRL